MAWMSACPGFDRVYRKVVRLTLLGSTEASAKSA